METRVYIEKNNEIVLEENGQRLAYLSWTVDPDGDFSAEHTVVDPSLRGQGIAGELLKRLMEKAEREGKRIHPVCSYIVKKAEASRENPIWKLDK